MTTLALLKHGQSGLLLPDDNETRDFIAKLKDGAIIRADFKKMRNPSYHRKYFALLNFSFDQWEPSVKTYKDQVVEKNFDRFRKDIAIYAGFYDVVVNVQGEVKYEAKSISFANMDDSEFHDLYEKTITVVMKKILSNYTREDIDKVVNQLLSFT